MLFKIFTTIVFIAELIIAYTIISKLVQFDRMILETNAFVVEANPKIKEITRLVRKISDQIAELVPAYVEKLKDLRNKIMLKKLESLIALTLFWSINIKVLKKFRKSKILKTVVKGLSVLQNVI